MLLCWAALQVNIDLHAVRTDFQYASRNYSWFVSNYFACPCQALIWFHCCQGHAAGHVRWIQRRDNCERSYLSILCWRELNERPERCFYLFCYNWLRSACSF